MSIDAAPSGRVVGDRRESEGSRSKKTAMGKRRRKRRGSNSKNGHTEGEEPEWISVGVCFLLIVSLGAIYLFTKHFSDKYHFELEKCRRRHLTSLEFLESDACVGELSLEFERAGLAKCHHAQVGTMQTPEQCARERMGATMVPMRVFDHVSGVMASMTFSYVILPFAALVFIGLWMYFRHKEQTHKLSLRSKERRSRKLDKRLARIENGGVRGSGPGMARAMSDTELLGRLAYVSAHGSGLGGTGRRQYRRFPALPAPPRRPFLMQEPEQESPEVQIVGEAEEID